MKKIVIKMISASLLAVPFSISAAELDNDVSLDDMYRYEDGYNLEFTQTSKKHESVSLDEMYRYQDGYNLEFASTPDKHEVASLDDMYQFVNAGI
ncbi:MAG: hypothetical protein ABF326_03225 [Arenicellales bacterium]